MPPMETMPRNAGPRAAVIAAGTEMMTSNRSFTVFYGSILLVLAISRELASPTTCWVAGRKDPDRKSSNQTMLGIVGTLFCKPARRIFSGRSSLPKGAVGAG